MREAVSKKGVSKKCEQLIDLTGEQSDCLPLLFDFFAFRVSSGSVVPGIAMHALSNGLLLLLKGLDPVL